MYVAILTLQVLGSLSPPPPGHHERAPDIRLELHALATDAGSGGPPHFRAGEPIPLRARVTNLRAQPATLCLHRLPQVLLDHLVLHRDYQATAPGAGSGLHIVDQHPDPAPAVTAEDFVTLAPGASHEVAWTLPSRLLDGDRRVFASASASGRGDGEPAETRELPAGTYTLTTWYKAELTSYPGDQGPTAVPGALTYVLKAFGPSIVIDPSADTPSARGQPPVHPPSTSENATGIQAEQEPGRGTTATPGAGSAHGAVSRRIDRHLGFVVQVCLLIAALAGSVLVGLRLRTGRVHLLDVVAPVVLIVAAASLASAVLGEGVVLWAGGLVATLTPVCVVLLYQPRERPAQGRLFLRALVAFAALGGTASLLSVWGQRGTGMIDLGSFLGAGLAGVSLLPLAAVLAGLWQLFRLGLRALRGGAGGSGTTT